MVRSMEDLPRYFTTSGQIGYIPRGTFIGTRSSMSHPTVDTMGIWALNGVSMGKPRGTFRGLSHGRTTKYDMAGPVACAFNWASHGELSGIHLAIGYTMGVHGTSLARWTLTSTDTPWDKPRDKICDALYRAS